MTQINSQATKPNIKENHLGPVMVDVQGGVLTEHEIKRLQNPLVGGIILFARNFVNRQQLTLLCKHIHAIRPNNPLLIAVDHEGGRVQRFKTDGFTHIPAMGSFGELHQSNPNLALRLASDAGYVLACELLACGIDHSFTPVLDLDYGVSDVIGSRSFSASSDAVVQLARALICGLSMAGMAATGKHFPGHGAVQADSHHEIPVDERSLEDILKADAKPYSELGDLLIAAVMPAHVIYPKVDKHPAGFSKIWIQDILREQLSYNGVVFSDDLTMQGATVAGDILARAQAALNAGCDMVLVCNNPDMADDLLNRLQHETNPESARRIQGLVPHISLNWQQLQSNLRYQNAIARLKAKNLSC